MKLSALLFSVAAFAAVPSPARAEEYLLRYHVGDVDENFPFFGPMPVGTPFEVRISMQRMPRPISFSGGFTFNFGPEDGSISMTANGQTAVLPLILDVTATEFGPAHYGYRSPNGTAFAGTTISLGATLVPDLPAGIDRVGFSPAPTMIRGHSFSMFMGGERLDTGVLDSIEKIEASAGGQCVDYSARLDDIASSVSMLAESLSLVATQASVDDARSRLTTLQSDVTALRAQQAEINDKVTRILRRLRRAGIGDENAP